MFEVQQLAVKFSQNSWDFYKLFKTVKIASDICKLYHNIHKCNITSECLIMVILAPSFMLSIVQLMFISVAAIISKYCFLADCSHYICQLYVNNGSQKYSLLDVLEMVYMY